MQEAILAQAWAAGGRVFAADAGEILADDADDPMRIAMRQMMGVFAQLERGMIRARMARGKRRAGVAREIDQPSWPGPATGRPRLGLWGPVTRRYQGPEPPATPCCSDSAGATWR